MAGEDDVDVDDDFSFPTTTCSPPRFIGSPRLWRSSSHSHKHLLQTKLTKQEHEREHEHDYECKPTLDDRKAINVLSYIRRKDAYGEGSGENMDVIWEDLNYEEEIGGVRRRNGRVSCDFGRELPEWGDKDGGVTVACGGGRRRRMVVLVNVLKKMLLLHQSERRRTTG